MALSFEDSLKTADAESANISTNEEIIEEESIDESEAMPMMASYSLASTYAANEIGWTLDRTKYKYFPAYADDNISMVDVDKNITLNPKQINITQEENSQYIPFEMPRYYDGFDLTETLITIHYTTKDNVHGCDNPVNFRYNEDKIKFAWLVGSGVTRVAGNIQFEIQARGATFDSTGKEHAYLWKSRPNSKMNVLQSICDEEEIVVSDSWMKELVEGVAEEVAWKIAEASVGEQVNEANEAAKAATEAAQKAEQFAQEAKDSVEDTVNEILDTYATKTYVDDAVAKVDVSAQLEDYAKKADVYTQTETLGVINSALEDYATKTYVDDAIAAADISDKINEKLNDYYTKEETYNRTEIDEKVSSVEVDLSAYYTKTEVDSKTNGFSDSIAENAKGITSLNKSVTDINNKIANIDNSPRVTYEATYGKVTDEDTGEEKDYMFTLWETEGENKPTVKSRFQIMGGGGGGAGNSVTLRISYLEGYTTPIVATVTDSVIIKYEFSGEDSAGDTNLDGVASWKVGNKVVATQDVVTGICEFDITEHVNAGDNKIVLTITHATGAVATKAWTVKVVDVRLDSSFDDTKMYAANSPVNFTFTPYGGVNKTIHFMLDGVEIATKTSSSAAAGLSDSYAIPAQSHGTHLFEIYMTADINGKIVESNHIVKDIIWYDDTSNVPIISCVKQSFTARQYEATNISYTVYDPSTETPTVLLRSTYTNDNGEVVEEFNSELVLDSNTQIWQYKTSVIGEHTLTITCGETVKTLVANIVELGINVSPITAGLVFDFNPVGYSNNDKDRLWTYKDTGIGMTVSDNFDWVNGGYQIDSNGDQCFCIKAGTSAEINYELFGDDAKNNGKEFKLIFKTENVADASTTFLSCVSDTIGTDKVGIDMKALEATIYAKTESLPLPYAEDEIIEFEFNITPSTDTPSMVMGYEDGVSTRPLVYDATHDFQQHKDHRKIISLGSNNCDLYIYRFKVYNTSLSDRDILNNFIADSRSAEEMISRYDRNQIYQDGILTPEHLAEVCPQLRIIKLEAPWFTNDKKDKVKDTTIECIYKNGDPIYDNWVATGCLHSGQGTSSNNYGASGRNLDLIMKKDKTIGNTPVITLGDGTTTDKVALTRESVPVNYFNVKVNIASSENANNALLQRRYNEYNPYTRPFVREDESIIPYIKDTMEFYNCVVFIKESETDLSKHREFADNDWHFYAIGNIGDSKKTDATRLTDPTDQYECILEVMDNTLPNSTMPTGKVDESGAPVYPIDKSEWTTGNSAYDALYGETFDEASSKDKPNGLDDTYGWRYIYEDGTDEENAAVRAYVENKWREFYEFVVTSTDEEFKAHLGDYCVLDSVMYYYLFTLRYTMTDNHAKNSFWHYGKSNDLDEEGNPIRKFDLCMDYDNDTALGIDNYGRMTYRYGYEEIDYVDGTQDWVWNAPQHVFFLRLRELFDAELCALYTRLESDGAWSATGLINQFNDWQSQFPEELWRLDIQRKYIRTYTTSFIGGEAKPEFLKERANGRKKTQRAQFEKNQEKYMSSKFGSNVAAADDIILRCSVPNTSLAVPANFDMHLTPYSYMYINVKYNTSTPIKVRAVPNVEYTIKYDAELADIIEIYSASCYKSIGDLSSHYLINGDFANASKIRELILGNSTSGYNNTNSMTLGLGANRLLNKLDIQNMSGLSHSLDLSGLKNLEEIYAFGSNISGVIFADRGNVSVAQLPSIGSLSMKNLSYLNDDGFDVVSYDKLSRLVAENSLLDLITLINNAPNLYQVRLTGINWTLDSTALLERLYDLAGVTNTGGNTDKSIVSGDVYVPVIRQQQWREYKNAWPDLEIAYGTMIEQFAVTFVNDDGTVLDVQYVDKGSDAVDPITRAENPIAIPTKESSVSTDYTFDKWDMSLASIFGDRIITATYTESTRAYTIKYVSKGITMQESTGLYGENVVYEGDTPTYTLEESAYKYYIFNRWDKSGFIDGDKTVNAIFDSFEYTSTSFDGKQLSDLTPVEIYALTQLGVDNVNIDIQDGDDYSFEFGHDVDYDDIESQVIISEETEFTGSNYIDTGIKLFDEDKDFVLAIDYKFLNGNSNGNVLAQCFQSNGANGFKLVYNNGVNVVWGTSTYNNVASVNNREMIIIRHKKGDNNLTVYNSNLSGSSVVTEELARTKSTIADSTLVLGCLKADDGAYENYAIGNINWCKIWYRDLGDAACKKLACWTHENIGLEVCGFKKYYLSDNPSKRCSFTMLATNLLSKNAQFGASYQYTGGWKESTLNTFLNTRLYEAVPTQIKSLIKKVTVTSSIGNKSTETSDSQCYIYIPSAIEMSNENQVNKAPYTSELTNPYTISYMTSNDMRKRAYANGDYAQYWLRSPNVEYANYIYCVDASGGMYGYVNAPETHGVLIELSF